MRSSSLETLARLGWRTSLDQRLTTVSAWVPFLRRGSQVGSFGAKGKRIYIHDHLSARKERIADEFAGAIEMSVLDSLDLRMAKAFGIARYVPEGNL